MRAVEVLQNIVDMTRELEDARGRVHRGQDVDMAGFDLRVRDLCLAATELPRAEGKVCADAFESIAVGLDRLTAALRMAERVDLKPGAKP
jgi:hypothetical protein